MISKRMHESRQQHFDMLRTRPAMILGTKSFERLIQYLMGYETATFYYESDTTNDPLVLPRELHNWAAYRFQTRIDSRGFRGVIQDIAKTDEQAFDLFMRFYEEYLNRMPHVIAQVVNLQKTHEQRVIKMVHDELTEVVEKTDFPTSMSLVTYTDDPGFWVVSDTDAKVPVDSFCRDIEHFEAIFKISRDDLTIVDPGWNYGIVED